MTSSRSTEPRTISKTSPVTGEELGEFPITTPDEVLAAVERARSAFPAWSSTPVRARIRLIERIKEVVEQRGEEFARRISEDTGKPYVDSLLTELMSVPLFIDYYARTARRVLRTKRVPTPLLFFPKSSYIQHFPMGVIAVISPWNFPFQLTMVPAISALLAGNTVVIKPSEVTPITGEIMREIFAAAKLPHGVVELIQGDGETGAALTRADVDKIFFTGSVATGRKVMAAAAEKPIPVELELGGKDAMIVCHDANLKRAAKGAVWGGLINAGQMCTSVERILVVDAVHDEFLDLLQKEVDRVKVGGPQENADMGPLTFPNQLGTIEAHVKDAVQRGAALLRGGKRLERPGQFFAPTIVADVTPDMEIYAEETFGPVLPVMRVRDENEAVRLANDHQYGLTGSVWTSDKKRGLSLAKRMHCGQVNVNDVVISVGNFALPFGGIKASGFGRYHGPEGLLSFTHQKAIMLGGDGEDSEPFWFPYAKKYPDMRDTFKALLRGNLPAALAAKTRLSKLTRESDS